MTRSRVGRNVRYYGTLASLRGRAEIVAGDKLRRDIQTWLSPPDSWKNHHITCKMWHGESGVWFVSGTTFSNLPSIRILSMRET